MKVSQQLIDNIIEEELKDFSTQFKNDYCADKGKKAQNILNKNNNVFIAALGNDIMVYSALMRSLDSSLGNRIEKIAKRIAEYNYIVKNGVKGHITVNSQNAIATLLEDYKTHRRKPDNEDLLSLISDTDTSNKVKSEKKSDYYLTLKEDTNQKFLLELKIGGDLDNKKAESEKSSLLHQYVTLRNSNEIEADDNVKIFFCTAYNKFGDDEDWDQERVKQFFSSGEILIGRDFWNFICVDDGGYAIVTECYKKHAHYIKEALNEILRHYSKKVGSLG